MNDIAIDGHILKLIFIQPQSEWDQDIDAMDLLRNVMADPTERELRDILLWVMGDTKGRVLIARLHTAVLIGVIFDSEEEDMVYRLTYT